MAAPLDVAVLGLGNMGRAAVERLLDAGHAVAVWNRSPGRDEQLVERGATRLDSPAQALQGRPVCLVVVSDDAACDQLVPQILQGAGGGTLVEMSTISVAASTRIAERCEAAGVTYLRAPFSGNPEVVRAGKASIFVSGDADATERLRPMLEAIAPTVRYVGEGERARVFKLVLQVLIGGIAELLGEAVALGQSAGIARKDLLDVIQDSVVGSRFTASKAGALIDDDYSATFTTLMMGKDIDLVLDLARQGGLDLPLMAELRRRLADAAEHGLADRDFIALFLRLTERAQETKAGANHD